MVFGANYQTNFLQQEIFHRTHIYTLSDTNIEQSLVFKSLSQVTVGSDYLYPL